MAHHRIEWAVRPFPLKGPGYYVDFYYADDCGCADVNVCPEVTGVSVQPSGRLFHLLPDSLGLFVYDEEG